MTAREAFKIVNAKHPGVLGLALDLGACYGFGITPPGMKGRIYGGLHKIDKKTGEVSPLNPAFDQDMDLYKKAKKIDLSEVL